MRITKVNIPVKPERKDGLDSIKMDRLESVVLLAGKNGAGKTRTLNRIFECFKNEKISNSRVEKARSETEIYQTLKDEVCNEGYKNYSEEQLQDRFKIFEVENLESYLEVAKKRLKKIENNAQRYQYVLEWNLVETDVLANQYTAVHFLPNPMDLIDPSELSQKTLRHYAMGINQASVQTPHQGVLVRIQLIQDRWFNATHPYTQIPDKEKAQAISDYERLGTLIRTFLNTDLERNIDNKATLFGFPLAKAKMSDGQKVLLQFCLAVYTQETTLTDMILVLDEPENHLHPSVVLEVIERIRKIVTNGQIWIATHSVPLLAHFDPSQIWFVEEGKIRHAGKIPEKVLESLLGSEEEVARLQNFTALPAQLAAIRYACESLVEPCTAESRPNDPQAIQVRVELLTKAGSEKIRILDFGAGQGRLLANLFDLEASNAEQLRRQVDYIAYDDFATDKESCEAAIAKVYGTASKRYYTDFTALFSDHDEESFDVVVMCNVLHEIDPKDWLGLFQPKGRISKCLKENGLLLLVEDHQMPVGEKAYQNGFLVLDTPQLKRLFKITEQDKDFGYSDQNGDGRLKTHRIPKPCLHWIDADSRIKALESVLETAKEQIVKLREADKNYKNGTLHGFWTQQLANAQLSYEELTTTAKPPSPHLDAVAEEKR